jgi:hypothetical protein
MGIIKSLKTAHKIRESRLWKFIIT